MHRIDDFKNILKKAMQSRQMLETKPTLRKMQNEYNVEQSIPLVGHIKIDNLINKIHHNLNKITQVVPIDLEQSRKIQSNDHTRVIIAKAYLTESDQIYIYQKQLQNQIQKPNKCPKNTQNENKQQSSSFPVVYLDNDKKRQLKQLILQKLTTKKYHECKIEHQNKKMNQSQILEESDDFVYKSEQDQSDNILDGQVGPSLNLKDRSAQIFKTTDLKLANSTRVLLSNNLLNKIKIKFQEHNRTKSHRQLQKIAFQCNLSSRFIYHLWYQWQKDPTLKRRMMCNITKQLGRGREILTEERYRFIRNVISLNPRLNAKEIAQTINEHQHLKRTVDGSVAKIKPDAILRYLKSMGFKQKKFTDQPSRHRNNPQFIDQRQQFALQYLNLKKKGSIYYYFWSPLSLFIKRRKCWIGPSQNQESIIPKAECMYFMAIMGFDKRVYFESEINSFNAPMLASYMRKLARNACEQDTKTSKYMIIEHEPLYKNNGVNVNHEMNQIGFDILCLPRYSSLLNPLHIWFQKIKKKLPKQNYKNYNHLQQAMSSILRSYLQYSLNQQITESESYLQTCIERGQL